MQARLICLVFSLLLCNQIMAATETISLQKASVDINDKAQLQRGAKIYMNYCSGCHSLKYMRYQRMAKDIDITTVEGEIDEQLLDENLLFDKSATVNDAILTAMRDKDAERWFGLKTPDLSLTVRSRGEDWIFTYLKSFYQDKKQQPWGVNNLLIPNVAMPHVLERLQGVRILVQPLGQKSDDITNAVKNTHAYYTTPKLAQLTPGELSPEEYDQTINDVVTFLSYVAEPNKTKRLAIGWYVIVFFTIFSLIAILLKREYWKDIK